MATPTEHSLDLPTSKPPNPWPALLFCMIFPTLMSWAETRWILPTPPEERSQLVQYLFLFGKILQFLFPLVYVALSESRRLRLARPSRQGMMVGVLFALVISAGLFVLYFVFLRGSELLGDTPGRMRDWLEKFGFNTMGGFLMFAAVISIPHSFLEENYWRWFVFGWLRREMSWGLAAVISALAFMSHHVVVLSFYLPGYFWLGVVPFSLCVAVGGVAWAWLYQRYENLYAPWVSHLIIDAAIMLVGWDMMNTNM